MELALLGLHFRFLLGQVVGALHLAVGQAGEVVVVAATACYKLSFYFKKAERID